MTLKAVPSFLPTHTVVHTQPYSHTNTSVHTAKDLKNKKKKTIMNAQRKSPIVD